MQQSANYSNTIIASESPLMYVQKSYLEQLKNI